MTEDETWNRIALPILAEIREAEKIGGDPELELVVESSGASEAEVDAELRRLQDGGYFEAGQVARVGGQVLPYRVVNARLTPSGAQAVGIWPSKDLYDALMAVLDRLIVEAPDEETRTALRTWKDDARDIGKGTLIGLLTSVFQTIA